ncbi:MAG: hypothetical protein M1817_000554 [Caeruleum heppii]|nr:MAG: hypothetical protein M1817_000554 [Caeruleum heppii]
MQVGDDSDVRKIAIIGGGPAGVAAAKYLRAEGKFETIDIFEQRLNVGGVWNYTLEAHDARKKLPWTDPYQPQDDRSWPDDDGHRVSVFASPMYDLLETNIPRSLMRYSDLAFPDDLQLFPSRQAVLQYLERHAEDVQPMLRLGMQVLDVSRSPRPQHAHQWLLKIKQLSTNMETESRYDAVIVASGHYNVPFIPTITGITKVLIVGNSASGLDIGTQIARVCRKPLLVSQRSKSYLSMGADASKEEVPEIEEFIVSEKALRFANGRIERDVDAILFCTGYLYSFPFLNSLRPKLVSNGARTQHVYKQIFYSHCPTLAFIGLPQKVIPFPLSECQSAVVARVWANRLRLPSEREMEAWEKRMMHDRGSEKGFHVLQFPLDADYINELYDWSLTAQPPGTGKTPPRWGEKERWARERFPAIKRAFADKGPERSCVRSMEDLGFDYEKWKAERASSGSPL